MSPRSFGWTTTAQPGFLIVHEARDFSDAAGGVPFTPGELAKYMPAAGQYIDWDAKTFKIPVQPRDTCDHMAWYPHSVEKGAKGDVNGQYLGHALLAAGFRGNAHYGGHEGKSLVWTVGADPTGAAEALIDAYAAECIERAENPGTVYFTLTNSQPVVDSHMIPIAISSVARRAVADALRRHFGGNVPVVKDSDPHSDLCGGGGVHIRNVKVIAHAAPEDVVAALLLRERGRDVIFAGPKPSFHFPGEWRVQWSGLADYEGRDGAAGILATSSRYLREGQRGYGWEVTSAAGHA